MGPLDSGPPQPSLHEFGVEQVNDMCKEQASTSKFVDCFLCIEPLVQMLEQCFLMCFWCLFAQ